MIDGDSFENLALEQRGAVLHVSINRPKVLNALDDQTLTEIAAAFDTVRTRADIRIVVLGGNGRAFSAGADLRNPPGRPTPESSFRQRRSVAETGHRACQAIAACEAVTVARVHGHAIGGGALLAISCDFRIGAEDVEFSLPEVKLGQPLSWGGTPLLIKEIGAARAREMIITGQPVDARRAEQFGLLHTVVPASALNAEVASWTSHLLGIPEGPVAATKQQFQRYAAATRLADLSETDSDIFTAMIETGATAR